MANSIDMDSPATAGPVRPARKFQDLICVLLLLATTLGLYSPSLFGGKVLLPADIVPIMRPWSVEGRSKLPEFHFAQTQLHGPIFEYYSWRHYARERIRAGEVPLWNPNELGGNVLLANSQSAVLYPPNALLYLFPINVGINFVTALHTFLTGVFLFAFLRMRKLQPVSALTAALVWMFCGVQMCWLEFQTPTAALCWLPGLLAGWEFGQQRGNAVLSGILCSAGIALTVLAGHLHFAFYVILAFLLYAGWHASWDRQEGSIRGRLARFAATAGAALVLGVAISAATLLPVVEMSRMNFRAGKTEYSSSIGLRMPPSSLVTLFQPNVFGSPRDYITFADDGKPFDGWPYFGPFDYIEYACYMGIPGFILAVLGGIVAFRKKPLSDGIDEVSETIAGTSRFFTGLAAIGLLLALGTPLCAVFFYLAPGYSQFNATGRALCLFCFGLAALSGVGVESLVASRSDAERMQKLKRRFGFALGVAALGGVAAYPGAILLNSKLLDGHWVTYESENLRHFVIFLSLTALCGWAILRGKTDRHRSFGTLALPALAAADLLVMYGRFNPQQPPWMLGFPTETTKFLATTSPERVVSLELPSEGPRSFIVPNYNAVVGYREVQGADSLHTQRYHQLLEKVVLATDPSRLAAFSDPNTLHTPNINHPLFDLLNVRYVTTLPKLPNPDPSRLTQIANAELTIWQNRKAIGPAWVVGKAEPVKGLDDFVARLADPAFEPRSTALMEGGPPVLDPQATGSTVTVAKFEPHRIAYDVDARGKGLLVTCEIAFPGWIAAIDGAPKPIRTADHILRSVEVEPGRHRVEISYRPASYLVGLYVSCFSLAALIGLILGSRCGRK